MTTSDTDLQEIRARVEAATPGPWLWQGNIDTGEPYLAGRGPGMGASVLAIGTEDRSTTGWRAEEVRAYALECGEDPDELVRDWATDRYDEPIKEPRLWFYTDHMAVTAREHVTFEVAPNAKHRDDQAVYRADITGIRHPDAEFIAHARTDIPLLLAALDESRAEVERITAVATAYDRHYRAEVDKRAAAESALTSVRELADELDQHPERISDQLGWIASGAIRDRLRAALTPTTTDETGDDHA